MTQPARALKIFLVENHGDTLTYITSYLKACGHEVVSARDMETALSQLGTSPIDVLISDIGLPDGDGWELMKKAREKCDPPPFGIAMSGYSMQSDLEKSLEAGFSRHLVKPFLPEELDNALREAANGKSH